MNKFRNIFFAAIILSQIGVAVATAAPDIGTGGGGLAQKIGQGSGYSTNVDEYTLSEVIGRTIGIALAFVGTIFFALTVYAGYLWMTAQGNEETVAKATGILRTAVIGMIIVAAAYSITAFTLYFSAKSTTFNR
jgi:hypothetical protein